MEATVADELLIQELPLDVQAVIARVYGKPAVGVKAYTEADLEEAFAAGFETAAEQMEQPYMSRSDFTSWLKSR